MSKSFLSVSMLAAAALTIAGLALAACDRQPDPPATAIPTPPVSLTAPELSPAPSPTPLSSAPCGKLCSEEFWEGGATVASVQAELEQGANPSAWDDNGTPTLAYAIGFSNNPEIVRLLLEAGADPNAVDRYAGIPLLHIAVLAVAYAYHPHNADRIPGDVDDYAEDTVEIIELLLEHGADAAARDKHGQSALFSYIANLAEQFLNSDKTHDPEPPDPRIVELLLTHGAELAAEHETDALVMQYAMWVGADAEVIALLLDHGAEDARKAWDYEEVTLLHLAAESTADIEVFKLLLERGEDVNAQVSFGWTVLHLSVRNNGLDPEVVRLLLDSGADVAAKGDQGDTPLHHAASHSGPEVISILLENGADAAARNGDGDTPCDVASEDAENVRALLCQ